MGKVTDKVRHKVAGGARKAAGKAKERARALRGAAKKRLEKTSVRDMLASTVRSVRDHYPFIDRFAKEFLRAFALNERADEDTAKPARRTRAARKTASAKSTAKTARRSRKKAA